MKPANSDRLEVDSTTMTYARAGIPRPNESKLFHRAVRYRSLIIKSLLSQQLHTPASTLRQNLHLNRNNPTEEDTDVYPVMKKS
jgi:hypothetical protein